MKKQLWTGFFAVCSTAVFVHAYVEHDVTHERFLKEAGIQYERTLKASPGDWQVEFKNKSDAKIRITFIGVGGIGKDSLGNPPAFVVPPGSQIRIKGFNTKKGHIGLSIEKFTSVNTRAIPNYDEFSHFKSYDLGGKLGKHRTYFLKFDGMNVVPEQGTFGKTESDLSLKYNIPAYDIVPLV